MPIINYKNREVNCKIVYVGPSLGGKTTNIKAIHTAAPQPNKSTLQCIDTEGDRTLFFDYFSLDLEEVQGFKTKFLIYGVPGQPVYKSTRKMVLNGVDGLVFVADSDDSRLAENKESLLDLKEMLAEYGYVYEEMPTVFQWNKRDLLNIIPVDELNKELNERNVPTLEAIAIESKGVIETFRMICSEVIKRLDETLAEQYYTRR
jgi:signal recognition particle receptor subunit beta